MWQGGGQPQRGRTLAAADGWTAERASLLGLGGGTGSLRWPGEASAIRRHAWGVVPGGCLCSASWRRNLGVMAPYLPGGKAGAEQAVPVRLAAAARLVSRAFIFIQLQTNLNSQGKVHAAPATYRRRDRLTS